MWTQPCPEAQGRPGLDMGARAQALSTEETGSHPVRCAQTGASMPQRDQRSSGASPPHTNLTTLPVL